MPTYDYLCESCQKRFEKLQSIQDDPIRVCPDCGGKVKRLISGGSGLIFKGSGFYITDYKKKGSSEGSEAGSNSKPSTDKSASSPSKTDKKES